MIRKMATSVSSTVQLVKTDENSYSFNTSSTFRKTQLAFVLNEEFIEVKLNFVAQLFNQANFIITLIMLFRTPWTAEKFLALSLLKATR